jgi:hypothetical protein
MEPASRIIKLLGGERAVAKVAGTTVTCPYRWQYPRENGGAGGQIPARHIPALIRYAKTLGIELSPNDFFRDEWDCRKLGAENSRTRLSARSLLGCGTRARGGGAK